MANRLPKNMKPDTLENHYDNLLIGAEDWAIQQVKEDIQRLRKENAELEETKKAFAPTFMREMHAECLRLERENADLKAWKETALILNAEMDEQALAKMLGGKLGRSCRKIISEEVPKLVEENATLREYKKKASERFRYLAQFWNPKNDFKSDEIGKWIVIGDHNQMIKAIDQMIKAINAARKEAQS